MSLEDNIDLVGVAWYVLILYIVYTNNITSTLRGVHCKITKYVNEMERKSRFKKREMSAFRRPGESAAPPPPATRAANGYEERRPEPPPPAGGESFSSTYTSYYDRFYSKASSNGAAASPQRPLMAQSGVRAAAAGRGAPSLVRNDQQAALQTGPIYF